MFVVLLSMSSLYSRIYLFFVLTFTFLPQSIWAQESEVFFPVSRFDVQYLDDYPRLPMPQAFTKIRVSLKRVSQGYTVPSLEDLKNPSIKDDIHTFALGEVELFNPTLAFSSSAINLISRKIVEKVNELGVVGIYVSVDTDQINTVGEDLRAPSDLSLTLYVAASTVSFLDAVEMNPDGEEVSLSKETKRILELSPVQEVVDEEGESNLLEKEALENYIFALNRHPSRKVDVRIRPEGENEASVHFLIQQVKPYRFIFNTSNSAKDRFDNQLDFVHNQLTGNDDTLKLSGSTTDWVHKRSHIVSYEAPFVDSFRHRFELHWSNSEFFSTVDNFVNPDGSNKDVLGKQFALGAKLENNVYQSRDFFIDVVTDVTFRNVKSNNKLGNFGWAEAYFLMPEVSLTFTRSTALSSLFQSISFQRGFPNIANTDQRQVNALGRGPGPDQTTPISIQPSIIKWNTFVSFFLEPIIHPQSWNDPSTPESSTLAHEVNFSTTGQYTNEYRLPPQFKFSCGGLYSVRGYPTDMDSGDIGFNINLEYKFHLPRVFNIQPLPELVELGTTQRPFKWAPSYVYDRPDWDLVFKAFVDYGRLINNARKDAIPDESNYHLLGYGLGLELMIKSYLQLRADWAVAVLPIKEHDIGRFYNRAHVTLSLVY